MDMEHINHHMTENNTNHDHHLTLNTESLVTNLINKVVENSSHLITDAFNQTNDLITESLTTPIFNHHDHGNVHDMHSSIPHINSSQHSHANHSMHQPNHHNMGGGHAMTFHGGHHQVLFFDAWKISTPTTLFYACLGVFVFSVLYEGLKVFREHLMSHPLFASSRRYPSLFSKVFHVSQSGDAGMGKIRHESGCCATRLRPEQHVSRHMIVGDGVDDSPPYNKFQEDNGPTKNYSDFNVQGFRSCDCKSSPTFSLFDHILQSLIHIVQTGLGFMLMLIFMTFNVYLCLALLLGAGFGYFCFAWKRRIAIVDVTQHCN